MTDSTDAQITSVYRYYDRHSILIYVGITSRGIRRNREHNSTKTWWSYVDRQEVEHFATRAEAHVREVELIQTHCPPYNTVHNWDADRMRHAYERFIRDGHSSADPMQAMRDRKGVLPLALVRAPVGRRAILRTRVQDSPISMRMEHAKGLRVLDAQGASVGKILRVTRQGPLALFEVSIRRGFEARPAQALVKDLCRKSETVFGLKHIRID